MTAVGFLLGARRDASTCLDLVDPSLRAAILEAVQDIPDGLARFADRMRVRAGVDTVTPGDIDAALAP